MQKYRVLLAHIFRKNRLQLLSFTAIILISALFLNLGLTVFLNFDDVYKAKWVESRMPDSFFVVYDADYSQDAVNEINAYTDVEDTEVRDCFYLYGDFSVGDDVQVSMPMVIYNRDDLHKYNHYTLIDSMPSNADNAAYVSYWFFTDKGCQLGDTLFYHTADKTYEFIISGFVEDMQYGNNNCGGIAIHLSQKCFDLFDNTGYLSAKAINIRTTSMESGEAVHQQALQRLSSNWTFSYGYNSGCYSWNKNGRTLMTNVIAGLIVAFALAITALSLLICGFRIGNGILEDMQNLGVQKSIGYQSGQIRLSVAMPYLLICVISTIIGIALSFTVLPYFTSLIETLTGLVWKQPTDIVSMAITSVSLFIAVVFTVAAATRKVKKYSPVEALQSGIHRHNFKHNFVSLDKTPLSVTPALGCKNMMWSMKQNIVVVIIMVVVTFLAMFATSAYYNMAIKTDNFLNAVSEEMSNVYAVTDGRAEELAEKLIDLGGIDFTLYHDELDVVYDGYAVTAVVCNNYANVNNDLIYEGRNPIHDNEIALGSKIVKDTEIGDTITLSYKDVTKDYLVVGFMQAPNKTGLACELTDKGFQRLNSTYAPSVLNIYLDDELTADECIEMLKDLPDGLILNIGNNDKTIETSMGTYINLTSFLAAVIFAVVAVILALMLFIVFSTIIFQRRQDYGILKAVGFTSRQLTMQTILGILPMQVLGIIAGCIAGALWMNRVWLLLFASMGVHKVNLGVPMPGAIGVGLSILLLSLLLSVLLCSGLKRISAFKLVRE